MSWRTKLNKKQFADVELRFNDVARDLRRDNTKLLRIRRECIQTIIQAKQILRGNY